MLMLQKSLSFICIDFPQISQFNARHSSKMANDEARLPSCAPHAQKAPSFCTTHPEAIICLGEKQFSANLISPLLFDAIRA